MNTRKQILRKAITAILLVGLFGCASSKVAPIENAQSALMMPATLMMPAKKFEAMLARGAVALDVPAQASLAFHDMRATAIKDSTVYLRVNQNGVALAVLLGQVQFVGRVLSEGDVCFWSRETEKVQVAEFDVAAFLAARKIPLDRRVIANLEKTAARQAGALWWGKVEREALGF